MENQEVVWIWHWEQWHREALREVRRNPQAWREEWHGVLGPMRTSQVFRPWVCCQRSGFENIEALGRCPMGTEGSLERRLVGKH